MKNKIIVLLGMVMVLLLGVLIPSPVGSDPPAWYYDETTGRLRTPEGIGIFIDGPSTFERGVVVFRDEVRVLTPYGIVFDAGPDTDVIMLAVRDLSGAIVYYDWSKDSLAASRMTNFTIDGNLVLETPVTGSDSPHIQFKTDATPYGTPDLEARIQLLNNSGDPFLRFQVEDDAVGPTDLTDIMYLWDNKIEVR